MTLQLRYTVAGQEEQVVPVVDPPLIMGTLLSNQVVLRAPGVDPIHALVEEHQGQLVITDLGSGAGVRLNGEPVEVESPIKAGDKITIGKVEILVEPYQDVAGIMAPPPPRAPQVGSVSLAEGTPPKSIPSPTRTGTESDDLPAISLSAEATNRDPASFVRHHSEEEEPAQRTVRQDAPKTASERRKEKKELLFSPRKARPSGDVLEVVVYWDDVVLDVDLFHPTLKDFDRVTIGDDEKSHFLAAGPGDLKQHILAKVGEGGYKIRLTKGMEARMRRGGKVETQSGPGSHKMGARDIAHIKFGPVRYFLLFIKPPSIRLPRSGPKDPIFATLMLVAALLYLAVIPALWLGEPKELKSESTDVWKLVSVPKKNERPKPRPKPKIEKPKVEVAEQQPEQKKPPKPPEVKQPPQPVTKPQQVTETKPPKVTKPQNKPQVAATKNLASNENQSQANNTKPNNNNRRAGPAGDNQKSQGMAKAGNRPDFKRPGPVTANKTNPRTGGPRGSGNNRRGGEIKGRSAVSVKGVEGPKNNRASGVNLSKLGLGAGKVLNKSGPGAIRSNFKNAAGGAGGGSGSGSRTYGLGGPGKSGSLGLSGSGGAVNNFGSGSGGLGSGQGGSGGRGGNGLSGVGYGRGGKGGSGGGRGRPNISIPASDAVVGGGLTRNEIMAVIRANLNQIRACYEQLLQRSPNASGKLKVQFVINAAGRVASVSRVGGNLTDSLMSGCVTGKIRRWKFPKPRGASSVEVKYPFGFTPL